MTDTAEPLPPPEERGRLDIHDDVVKTIARRAAASVSTTHRAAGLTRIATHDLPHVRGVTVQHGLVDAAITVAAPWPTPVAEHAQRVRTVVAAHILDYTGLTVARVDVDVHCIPRDERPTRRVQ